MEELFYQDSENYNSTAEGIATEFENAFEAILVKYKDRFSLRELEYIAFSAISMVSCEQLLDKQHRLIVAKRKRDENNL